MIIESFVRTTETTIDHKPVLVTFHTSIQSVDGAIYTTFSSVKVEDESTVFERSERFDNYHSEAEAFSMAVKVMVLPALEAIEYVKVRPEVV